MSAPLDFVFRTAIAAETRIDSLNKLKLEDIEKEFPALFDLVDDEDAAAEAAMKAAKAAKAAIKFCTVAADPEDVDIRNKLPAAIVYPLADEARSSVGGRAGAVQRATARIGVVSIVNVRNRQGGAGVVDRACHPVLASRAMLVNWTPDFADAPMALTGGALEEIADGRMYWLDRYEVEFTVDYGRNKDR